MRIHGIVPLASPLHIADGNRQGYDPETGREASNITATQRAAVMTPDGRKYIPCMDPGPLRGRIRRKASDRIIDAFLARGAQMSLGLFTAIRHGATSGEITRSSIDPRELLNVRKNPFFGLFGGGPRMIASLLITEPTYTACAEYYTSGLADVDEVPESAHSGYSYLEIERSYPAWDIMRRPDNRFGAVIANFDESMDEMLLDGAAKRQAKRAKKDEKKGDKPEEKPADAMRTSNIIAHEAVIAGTPMAFSIRTHRDTPPEAKGQLLVALADALNEGSFGGVVRNGYGNYNLKKAAENLKVGGETVFEYNADADMIFPAGAGEEYEIAFNEWEKGGDAWINPEVWIAAGFGESDIKLGKKAA